MARPPSPSAAANASPAKAGDVDLSSGKRVLYWHDPMVPGPRFDKPGKSPFMDMQLVPVYADEAGARHEITRHTATADAMPAALPGAKTVLITSVGDAGDARPDLVAVVGYLAGRLALGAPELAR